jgi:hypothetical protein
LTFEGYLILYCLRNPNTTPPSVEIPATYDGNPGHLRWKSQYYQYYQYYQGISNTTNNAKKRLLIFAEDIEQKKIFYKDSIVYEICNSIEINIHLSITIKLTVKNQIW